MDFNYFSVATLLSRYLFLINNYFTATKKSMFYIARLCEV